MELTVILEGLSVPNFVTGQQMPIVVAQKSEHNEFILGARLGFSKSPYPVDASIAEKLCLAARKEEIVSMSSEKVVELAKVNFIGLRIL